jgi:two-component system, NtrC family, response regulator AtoC
VELIPQIDLDNPISLKEITKAATQELERQIILRVLNANRWNRLKAARWFNIRYRSLLYKLQAARAEGNAHLTPTPLARRVTSPSSPLVAQGGIEGTEGQIRPM